MKKIINPILFQGNLNKRNYFEGWYYKQVSMSSNKTISFIPGISLSEDDSHAFIQVIESSPIKTYYFRYDLDSFSFGENPFFVKVGDNIFAEDGIELNIKDKQNTIIGSLKYGPLEALNTSLIMPNIMGVFAYIPRMSCNHGVISMSHIVNGQISLNSELIDFENDKGYIEKDWGTSFPKKYIWMQGNHFSNEEDSFMLSIATVPMAGLTFLGLIANILIDGIEYRVATYNGGKIDKVKSRQNGVDIEIRSKDLIFEISANMIDSGELKAPIKGRMTNVIKEGLGGEVSLVIKKNNMIYKTIKTKYAGIEVVGEFNISKSL